MKEATNINPSSTSSPIPSSKTNKWIEIIPHGLVGGMIPNLCLMVFKEKSGSKRFAISLPPLQGKIALNQSLNREEPFRFISELLNALQVRIEKCFFIKNNKGCILVQIMLSGHPTVHSLQFTASEIIPFAVYSSCQFYCTKNFITEMLDQKIEPSHSNTVQRKPVYLN